MSVKKTKGGWGVYHCSGGKTSLIAKHKTKKKALAQHRAIMANKKKPNKTKSESSKPKTPKKSNSNKSEWVNWMKKK